MTRIKLARSPVGNKDDTPNDKKMSYSLLNV